MRYPGDVVAICLDLREVLPVTTVPVITILEAVTETPQIVSGISLSANMTLVGGTPGIYKFLWSTTGIASGNYIVVASYIANAVTYTNTLIRIVELGDSFVTGPVALDSTVAKDGTVAHDATVMHLSDFVPPANDLTVQMILSRIQALPNLLASQATLGVVQGFVNDLHDIALGSQTIDKTAGIITYFRQNGSILAQFSLSETTQYTSRATGVAGGIPVPPGGGTVSDGWASVTPISGTVTFNLSSSQLTQEVTMTSALTVGPAVGVISPGTVLSLKFRQDATGGWQITFDPAWIGIPSVPDMITTASTYGVFQFRANGAGQFELEGPWSSGL